MIKWLLILFTAAVLAVLGWTVPIGKRTFFGHVRAIWHSEPAKDLKDGVNKDVVPALDRAKEKIEKNAGPAVKRVKRGIHDATSGGDAAPTIDAGVPDAR